MRACALLVLALVLAPAAAHAYSAGDLLRDCKLQVRAGDRTIQKGPPTLADAMAIGGCTAYLDATAQTLNRISKSLPVGDKARVCLLQNYTIPNAIGQYIKFMEDKPQSLGSPAAEMAMAALARAYPCH